MQINADLGAAWSLVVADGCSRPVEFRDVNCERLIVGLGAVLQNAEPHRFTQQKRLQA